MCLRAASARCMCPRCTGSKVPPKRAIFRELDMKCGTSPAMPSRTGPVKPWPSFRKFAMHCNSPAIRASSAAASSSRRISAPAHQTATEESVTTAGEIRTKTHISSIQVRRLGGVGKRDGKMSHPQKILRKIDFGLRLRNSSAPLQIPIASVKSSEAVSTK